MSFEELLRNIVNSSKKKEKYTIPVGKVSVGIVREFAHFKREEEQLMDEVDIEKKKLELEFQERMRDKFDDRFDLLQERQHLVWDLIYSQLNIDPENSYQFNIKTGKVYMEVEENNTDPVNASSDLFDDNQLH